MKNYIFIILLFVVFYSCSTSKDPMSSVNRTPDKIDLSNAEIHYCISRGWGNTHKLDINPDGSVIAQEIQHASFGKVLDSSYTTLSDDEKTRLFEKFGFFDDFERNYLPEKYLTDQDFHHLIFLHQGNADTVDVYMPGYCNLPNPLRYIFNDLQSMMYSMLE